jgi:putative membrane protein
MLRIMFKGIIMTDEPVIATAPSNSSFELASRNTSLAFQRTRMAADRTLMAVIRTSLSLISFGFTIYKIAQNLAEEKILKIGESFPHFGISLVLLGIVMLAIGIIYHGQFMLGLRTERKRSIKEGLIRDKSPFPPSFTLITALILLGLGIAVIISMIFHIGPFE